MVLRKNPFSFIFWLLQLILCAAGLVGCLLLFVPTMDFGMELIAGAGLAFLGLGLLSFLAHFCVKTRSKDTLRKEKTKTLSAVAEGLFVILMLAISLSARIFLTYFLATESDYFAQANTLAGAITPSVHTLTYLYLLALRLVCMASNNSLLAGAFLSQGLYLLFLLILMRGIRRLAGPFCACAVFFYGLFSPALLLESMALTPAMLYLFLWGLCFYFVSLYLSLGKKHPLLCIFLGLLLGTVAYTDATLLLFLPLLILGTLFAKGSAKRCLDVLAAALLSFGGAVLLDAFTCQKSIERVLLAQSKLYVPAAFSLSFLSNLSTVFLYEILCVAAALSFGVFSFFFCGKQDRRSFFLGAAGLWLLLPGFCLGQELTAPLLVFVLLLVCVCAAGLGDVLSKAPRVDGPTAAVSPAPSEQSLEGCAAVSGSRADAVVAREEQQEEGEEESQEKSSAEEAPCQAENAPVPAYFENPLPLPKKHVARAMTYDILEEEVKDDYDVAVSENDDYEIR